MTKLAIIWLIVLSILASFLLLIFHGSSFVTCYSPFPDFRGFELITNQPLVNCLIYAVIIALGFLIIIPIIITSVFFAIYALIFNTEMPFSATVLWLCWLTILYFLTFQAYNLYNLI